MFIGDGVGRLEAERTGGLESVLWVIARMAEHEHQVHTIAQQLFQNESYSNIAD